MSRRQRCTYLKIWRPVGSKLGEDLDKNQVFQVFAPQPGTKCALCRKCNSLRQGSLRHPFQNTYGCRWHFFSICLNVYIASTLPSATCTNRHVPNNHKFTYAQQILRLVFSKHGSSAIVSSTPQYALRALQNAPAEGKTLFHVLRRAWENM